MIEDTDTVFLHGQMVNLMMVIGKTENKMEKALYIRIK